jgi:diguanylate cyclase (GGDEF)-like protein
VGGGLAATFARMDRNPTEHERATTSRVHDAAVLAATRELLWIEGPDDARAAAVGLVEALGGVVIPADQPDPDALPVDVSFGQGVPLVPSAPSVSVARMLLSRYLPGFLRDAHRAVELSSRARRLAEEAEIDPLTGLATRRVLGRFLGRLGPDDVVVLIDLDDFKALNDARGHVEGDRVLSAFGRTITETVRARDLGSRYGGEEFVVVLVDPDEPSDAEAYLARLRDVWERSRPHPVTFSAGLATALGDRSRTLQAADEAMYEAKGAGGDRWLWAGDPASGHAPRRSIRRPGAGHADGFVAHSQLTVPEGGREELTASFEDRLGLVDGWPGFRRLEVWADRGDPTAFVLVSWWDSEDAFRAYMGSEDHRRSHARVPQGELRPRPDTFRRYEVICG